MRVFLIITFINLCPWIFINSIISYHFSWKFHNFLPWHPRSTAHKVQRQPISCLPGSSVAFGLGRHHWINGRGNQNPAFRGLQVPLVLGGFIGSMAEATKILLSEVSSCLWSWAASSNQWQKQPRSCFPGSSVAFDLGRLHRINGRGNQNPAYRGLQLPLVLGGFIGSMAEATNILLAGIFSCLWSD